MFKPCVSDRFHHSSVYSTFPVTNFKVFIDISSSSRSVLCCCYLKNAGILYQFSHESVSITKRVDMVIFKLVKVSERGDLVGRLYNKNGQDLRSL